MRNAKLAITSKQTNEYEMISKPSFWDIPQEIMPSMLFAITLSFRPSKAPFREYRSLVLLTRRKYPELPAFSIFLDDDVETTVSSKVIQEGMEVSNGDIECLTDFTLRVFRDVFQKVYDKEPEKMPYWLAPAIKAVQPNMASHPRQLIDWETISFVQNNEEISFSESIDPSFFINRFAYDPWDGRFRLFTTAIDDSLRPTDPPPSYVARRRFMDNIMSYCLSLSKNSRAKFFSSCNWNQPVFHAELVRLRRNLLDKMTDNEKESTTKCVVCIEALRISAVCAIAFSIFLSLLIRSQIPLPVATSCFAFPAIISRLDSYMIALQACDKLDLSIAPEYALEAFTKNSDNTEEHRNQQVHLQRGMGKNYERLEFLGDSFLKMATSIALFTQNPNNDEYDYHVNRMCLICNKNLFNSAIKKHIYMYIRSRGFSRYIF